MGQDRGDRHTRNQGTVECCLVARGGERGIRLETLSASQVGVGHGKVLLISLQTRGHGE